MLKIDMGLEDYILNQIPAVVILAVVAKILWSELQKDRVKRAKLHKELNATQLLLTETIYILKRAKDNGFNGQIEPALKKYQAVVDNKNGVNQ